MTPPPVSALAMAEDESETVAAHRSALILPLRPVAPAPNGKLRLPRPIDPPEIPPLLVPTDDLPALRRARARPLPEAPISQSRTIAPRERGVALPDRWTVVHVLDRLEEAYEILGRLPMAKGPRGHANSMPTYAYDRADRNAQMETGELERMMRLQNRVRISATAAEVTRMEQALWWPWLYLADKPEVARAVQLGARWAAMRIDAHKRLKAMGVNRRWFNRRKMHGLQLIAIALIRDDTPVA